MACEVQRQPTNQVNPPSSEDLFLPQPIHLGWAPRTIHSPTSSLKAIVLPTDQGREMSRNHGKNPKPELRLNLSAKQMRARGGPSTRVVVEEDEDDSSSSPSISPPSSCVSSEGEQKSNSPEATSMVLAGCPRCLMYVMLSEKDPKCPKCKSTVLLDFQRGNTSAGKNRRS